MYKVPQDVEAEDKFLGPLSFKQFLFFGGTAICGYITFLMITKHIWVLMPVFALPTIVFGILAFPWSKEQPSELWLAAHIRFYFINRKRIWDQSGMKDLVTITAPKREVHSLTDGLTQDEVKNRFNALASVVDSRGWAIKNLSGTSSRLLDQESDRLVTVANTVPSESEVIISQTADIMDESSNPLAQQFDNMIADSKTKHRQNTLSMIEEARQMSSGGAGLSMPLPTLNPKQIAQSPVVPAPNIQTQSPLPQLATFQNQTIVSPTQDSSSAPIPVPSSPPAIKTEDEQELLQKVHAQQQQEAILKQQSHLKTIQPISAQQAPPVNDLNPVLNPGLAPVDPAILELSRNDDLNVDTIARQANKGKLEDEEVIIELH